MSNDDTTLELPAVASRTPLVARINARFDPSSNEPIESASQRKQRLLRPGAILLPNLDIDGTSPSRAGAEKSDALADETINNLDDASDLTSMAVSDHSDIALSRSVERIEMKIAEEDAQRVRVFRVPESGNVLQANAVMGPGKGPSHVVAKRETQPKRGWKTHFRIEALTLAGDPRAPAPNKLAPPPAGPANTPEPATKGGSSEHTNVNATDQTKSSHPDDVRFEEKRAKQRPSNDVWIELVHQRANGSEVTALHDTAVFTIAPWILAWETLPTKRVYICRKTGSTDAFPDLVDKDNHSAVWDFKAVAAAAGLSSPPGDSTVSVAITDPATVHSLSDAHARFYVIEADDPWAQDEMKFGFCVAPHASMHIAVQMPRSKGASLASFLVANLPHNALGLFSSLKDHQDNDPEQSPAPSTNYGGNFLASPPVKVATGALYKAGGPQAPSHSRPAPWGKIVYGDCAPAPINGALRRFLQTQHVQPLVPVDTSWLEVGHIDELISFVHANNAKGFKLAVSSPLAMSKLLSSVLAVDPIATMHAGKYADFNNEDLISQTTHNKTNPFDHMLSQGYLRYDERSVRALVKLLDRPNLKLHSTKLKGIETRVRMAVDLTEDDVLHIPVFFERFPDPTQSEYKFKHSSARTSNMTNLQPINTHLAVPRPFGPLLSAEKAAHVTQRALKLALGDKAPPVPSPKPLFFWARPQETLRHIALYFARTASASLSDRLAEKTAFLKALRNASTDSNARVSRPYLLIGTLKPSEQKTILDFEQALLKANPAASPKVSPNSVESVVVGNETLLAFKTWMRLRIPGDLVDVCELYVRALLEAPDMGNTVHFVDCFELYHIRLGEIHCGTNAIREFPESDPNFTDRWWNSPCFDPTEDNSYSPSKVSS